MKVSVAGMERSKCLGRTLQALQELRPHPKSRGNTWGRIGGGQEGIQFHSVSCGTQRHTRKRVLEPLVGNFTQLQVSPDSC